MDNLCGIDCPWSGSSQGVDLGCLPTAYDMMRYAEKGFVISCHSNEKIPCKGYLEKYSAEEIKVKKLVPHSRWYLGKEMYESSKNRC